jgi:hypothetical protein
MLPERGHSPRDAIDFDETKWRSLTNDLDNIATQIRFSPRERLDLLGFPTTAPWRAHLSASMQKKPNVNAPIKRKSRQIKLPASPICSIARFDRSGEKRNSGS